MHEPIEITIGVTGSQGINSIDYKAFLGKSPVPQRLEVDVVVMSISTGATDGSASIFGGSMAVIHIDQSQASSHPENGAVAAMVGPDIKPWFGNIVVVACNAEGTVFVDMTSATVARDCVMW
jgi:hypothetical protein